MPTSLKQSKPTKAKPQQNPQQLQSPNNLPSQPQSISTTSYKQSPSSPINSHNQRNSPNHTTAQHEPTQSQQYSLKSSKILKVSNQILSKQKYQLYMMEEQVRKINRRIKLQQELIRNKMMFQKLEEDLKNQQEAIKIKKKQIIKSRIQQLQHKKLQREQKDIESSKIVSKIKNKQKKKQIILQKILENNKNEYDLCYKNALKQRKVLLKPINFQAIKQHEINYSKNRLRFKTEHHVERQQQQQNSSKQASEQKQKIQQKSHKINVSNNKNNKNRSKTINYDNDNYNYNDNHDGDNFENRDNQQKIIDRYNKNNNNNNNVIIVNSHNNSSSNNNNRRVNRRNNNHPKSSLEQYIETRRKQQKRIQQIKYQLNLSKQYGNRVQNQFHKNRSKTESIQLKKQQELQSVREKASRISYQNQILQKLRKPQLPHQITAGNIQTRKNIELRKIIKSNTSTQDKMIKLSLLSEIQLFNINNKKGGLKKVRKEKGNTDRYGYGSSQGYGQGDGDQEYFQRLTEINMMRAQLLLAQQ